MQTIHASSCFPTPITRSRFTLPPTNLYHITRELPALYSTRYCYFCCVVNLFNTIFIQEPLFVHLIGTAHSETIKPGTHTIHMYMEQSNINMHVHLHVHVYVRVLFIQWCFRQNTSWITLQMLSLGSQSYLLRYTDAIQNAHS